MGSSSEAGASKTYFPQENRRLNSTCLCHFKQVGKREILFPSFQLAHIGPVNTTKLGEVLLAEACTLPRLADSFAKQS